jgi:hypothetical protein
MFHIYDLKNSLLIEQHKKSEVMYVNDNKKLLQSFTERKDLYSSPQFKREATDIMIIDN